MYQIYAYISICKNDVFIVIITAAVAVVAVLCSDCCLFRSADFKTLLIDNEIYLYKMLTTNLLQAMLVRRAEQSHQQSSNSAICACYAHIHRSSITLRCSQTTRSHDQMIMWLNSKQKFTSKWSAFTIHRSSIVSRCSQTIQSSFNLLN